MNSHGTLCSIFFVSLVEYKRVLITERVNAGSAAPRRSGRKCGRPQAINEEKVAQVLAALEAVASKASVSRTFKVARSTSFDTLKRTVGNGHGKIGMPELPV